MAAILAKLCQLLALGLLYTSGCCAQNPGDVRIVPGEQGLRHSGRLEVYLKGLWGTVCDDSWQKSNEDVVCRQLGYFPRPELLWRTVDRYNPGSGSTSIVMDNVICTGSETKLTSCSYLSTHDCDHSEDVGVTCSIGLPAPDIAPDCGETTTFETGLMGYRSDPTAELQWTFNRGPTPSEDTGPLYDHTQGRTVDGQYLYMEASSPATQYNKAILMSPVYPAPQGPCTFTFWYSMYGATIGQLNVVISYNGIEEEAFAWTKSGDQGQYPMFWSRADSTTVENRGVPFQILFQAIRGSDYTGDIAIDDIALSPGCCTPKIECHPLTAAYPLKLLFHGDVGQVTYSCHDGYWLEGDPSRRCSDLCYDGSCKTSNFTTFWSGAEPRCIAKPCPVLSPPRYGRASFVHGEEGFYQTNTTLEFNCVYGFTRHGSHNRTCLADGTWSGQEATCEPMACPQLATPVNGWSTPLLNGTEEIVGCYDGYYGRSKQTCLRNGFWDGAKLDCAALNCDVINSQWPLRSEYTNLTLGSIARHSCPLGFVLRHGNETRVCQGTCSSDVIDGRLRSMCNEDQFHWSGETPFCAAGPCAPLIPPDNGFILSYSLRNETHTTTEVGFRGVYGMKVMFACDLGYELHNSSMGERQCVHHRRWTGIPPKCVAGPCEAVFAPENGRVVSYVLHNITHNVTVQGFTGLYGMKVDLACNAGYKLEHADMRQRECVPQVNGWSGDDPKCGDVCAGVSCPEDRKCQTDPGSPNSHTCACKDAIDCPRVPELVCASNTRTYQHPCLAAVEACHQNTTISIVATGRCLPASICAEAQPRAQLASSCPGMSTRFFFNSTSSRCERMLWADCFIGSNIFAVKSECQRRCTEVDPCQLQNDTGICSGYEARYFYQADTEQCTSFSYGGCYGNENNFNSRDACEACNKRCPALQNPANGELYGRRRFVGSTARFTCARGYTISGSAERVCQPSLEWTGEPVVCEQECVHQLCRLVADYTCPIGKNSVEMSCGAAKEQGLIDFAFSAFIDPSQSRCTSKGTYSIELNGVTEFMRTQNCSFLPDVLTDVIAEADFRLGCPCPLPKTFNQYLVTGLCNQDDHMLKLTSESVFVSYNDAVQNDTEAFCGVPSRYAFSGSPSFG